MSKSDTTESDLLKLIYQAVSITNLATSTGATNISWHLHTADPGESGSTTTSECSYGSYAAKNIARSSGGHAITGNSISPVAVISFDPCTSGTQTATHFSTSLQGSTVILHSGLITPPIAITTGITPQLSTTTAITED